MRPADRSRASDCSRARDREDTFVVRRNPHVEFPLVHGAEEAAADAGQHERTPGIARTSCSTAFIAPSIALRLTPRGPRRWTSNSASSTSLGMYSCLTTEYNGRAVSEIDAREDNQPRVIPIDQSRTADVGALDSRVNPRRDLAPRRGRIRVLARSIRALIIGVSVNETSRLTSIAAEAVKPN